MRNLLMALALVLGLGFVAAPVNACSDHGYIAANTLDDLFDKLPDMGVNMSFSAGGVDADNAQGPWKNGQLSGHSDRNDDHTYSVSVKDANGDPLFSHDFGQSYNGANGAKAAIDWLEEQLEEKVTGKTYAG